MVMKLIIIFYFKIRKQNDFFSIVENFRRSVFVFGTNMWSSAYKTWRWLSKCDTLRAK